MNSNNKYSKLLYTICAAVFIIGLFLFIPNAKHIMHSSIINPDYVSNSVRDTSISFSILGSSPNDSQRRTYRVVYEAHAHSGNMALVGIAISVGAIVFLLIVLKANNVNEVRKQTELLKAKKTEVSPSIDDQLTSLISLKKKGLITEVEYDELRKSILEQVSSRKEI